MFAENDIIVLSDQDNQHATENGNDAEMSYPSHAFNLTVNGGVDDTSDEYNGVGGITYDDGDSEYLDENDIATELPKAHRLSISVYDAEFEDNPASNSPLIETKSPSAALVSGDDGGLPLTRNFHSRNQSYDVSAGGTLMTADFEITREHVIHTHSNSRTVIGKEILLCDLIRLGELGRGCNGCVVKALHVPSLTILALKTVSLHDRAERHQLLRELTTFTRAAHKRILSLFGANFSDGHMVTLALDFINRGSLEHLVNKHGPLSEPAIKHVAKQTLEGLSFLHSIRCIHRDIKPANLLIDQSGRLVISDFGLMKELEGTQQISQTFVGTLSYLSPERINSEGCSFPSDVWSFGIALTYLARGHMMLPKEYFSLLSVLNGDIPKLTVADGFSAEMCDFISSCLQRDVDKRGTADSLLKHPWLETVDENVAGPWQDNIVPTDDELSSIIESTFNHHGTLDRSGVERLAVQLGCDPELLQAAVTDRMNGGRILTDPLGHSRTISMADEINAGMTQSYAYTYNTGRTPRQASFTDQSFTYAPAASLSATELNGVLAPVSEEPEHNLNDDMVSPAHE